MKKFIALNVILNPAILLISSLMITPESTLAEEFCGVASTYIRNRPVKARHGGATGQ